MNINAIKNALSTRAANAVPTTAPAINATTKPVTSSAKTSAVVPTVATKKPVTSKSYQQKIEPIETVIASILVPNQDYGMIPGCKKPSLLKSGAEKLCAHFGYNTQISIIHRAEIYEKSLISYEIKVTVYSSSGIIHAEGVGAANSRERKFLKGDFFSQINTVLKMAKKRAYVDAILTATGASGIFTQDMEDIGAGASDHKIEAIG